MHIAKFTNNDTPYDEFLLLADVQCRIFRVFSDKGDTASTSI